MAEGQKKILVVDDEDDIRMLVEARMKRAGYQTVVASDGQEGLRIFYSDRPDLMILDITMPVMDGWQVFARIREVSDVPVIMLTASGEEHQKVRGLRGGADDYVTKPFSGEELLARVEATLRRVAATEPRPANVYTDSEVIIDYPRHEVTVRGEQVHLGPTEFRLLGELTKHAGQVLSQDQILDRVWGTEYTESVDVVRLYVGYLRRKIEADPSKPKLIETVRGFGYKYRKPGS